jgi:hypothetical protein
MGGEQHVGSDTDRGSEQQRGSPGGGGEVPSVSA